MRGAYNPLPEPPSGQSRDFAGPLEVPGPASPRFVDGELVKAVQGS